MKRKSKKFAGLALALLWLSVSIPVVIGISPRDSDPAKENQANDLKPVSTEIRESLETEDPELDDEAEITLEKLREFWTREEFPHEDEFLLIPFRVPPRQGELEYYPCMDCHEDKEINNPAERVLADEHESIRLDHGGKRFWCPTCHFLENMNYLRSLKNRKIHFNRSYLLCGQCHFQRQKDWFLGAHGKRIANWNGPRIILVCAECHNPHSPSIKPKHADPPPKKHRIPDNILVKIMGLFK